MEPGTYETLDQIAHEQVHELVDKHRIVSAYRYVTNFIV